MHKTELDIKSAHFYICFGIPVKLYAELTADDTAVCAGTFADRMMNLVKHPADAMSSMRKEFHHADCPGPA